MRKLYLLSALFITALIVGCNSDVFVEEADTIDKGDTVARTIKLTTVMPGESSTRVAMVQDGLDVVLTWKSGDEIYLIFAEADGITPVGKQTITLNEGDITDGGKTAHFNIIIPDEVTGETFDLYGVHGGNGFVEESGPNQYELLLPTAAQSMSTSIEELSEKAAMIKFVAKGVSKTESNVPVNFVHMGSFFRLEIKNDFPNNTAIANSSFDIYLTGKDEDDVGEVIQAHQNIGGNATFSPISGEYADVETKVELPLGINVPTNGDVPHGSTLNYWGWYIPVDEAIWPQLSLKVVRHIDGSSLTLYSNNSKPARTAPTATGKAFHFYATFDGNLFFTNAETTMIDTRDGNIYRIVKIGEYELMAENLKYMSNTGFGTDYRVLSGNNPREARRTEAYWDYGVYYSWETAKTACPPGWRLPESLEFFSLFSAEEAKAFKSDGDYHWSTDNGENSNGFNAYGGGYIYNNEGSYDITEFKELAVWWSSAEAGTVHQIKDKDGDAPGFEAKDFNKDLSYVNVRCIRDTSSGGGVDH